MPALGHRQEQREQGDGHEEPQGHVNLDGDGPAGGAQHKAGCDGQDVQEDGMLQPERVEQADTQVHQDNEAQPGTHSEPQENGPAGQEYRQGFGEGGTDQARRHGAQALLRMDAILPGVERVVQAIRRGRRQAETDKGEGREADGRRGAQFPRVEQGGKHEPVLHPLLGPDQSDQSPQRNPSSRRKTGDDPVGRGFF